MVALVAFPIMATSLGTIPNRCLSVTKRQPPGHEAPQPPAATPRIPGTASHLQPPVDLNPYIDALPPPHAADGMNPYESPSSEPYRRQPLSPSRMAVAGGDRLRSGRAAVGSSRDRGVCDLRCVKGQKPLGPMFRYRLRTLLIVLSVLPPMLAAGWWGCAAWRARLRPVGYSVQPDGSVRIVTEPAILLAHDRSRPCSVSRSATCCG